MLRKFLSVFVICFFMFSNICYAASSVGGYNPAVDNIALRSVLQGSAQDLEIVTTLFKSLAGQDVNDMWAKNLAENNIEKSKDGKSIIAGDLSIEVSASADTDEIKISMKGQKPRYIRIENGVADIFDTPASRASGKATAGNEQNLLNKFEADDNIINDAAKTAQTKAAFVANLETRINRAIAAGRLSNEEIKTAQDMIKAAKAVDFKLAKGMIFEDKDNYINGSNNGVNAAQPRVIVNSQLSAEAGSDVFDHEIAESVLGDDSKALDFLMKVDGIKDRKNTQEKTPEGNVNQMAATRNEIQEKVQQAQTDKQQAEPSDEVKLPSSVIELSKQNPTKDQKKAVVDNFVKNSNLTAEQKTQINDGGVDVGFDAIVKLAMQKFANFAAQLKGIMINDNFLNAKAEANKTRPLAQAADLNKENVKTVVTRTDIMDEKIIDGKTTYPLTAAGAAYIDNILDGQIKAGIANVIDMTEDQRNQLYKQIDMMAAAKGLDVKASDLITTYEGSEEAMVKDLQTGQSLVVVYSQDAKSSVARTLNKDIARYVEVKDLNKGNSDILSAIIQAMNLKLEVSVDGSLSGTMDKIEFNPDVYEQMKESYTAIVNILIQA